MALRFSKSYVVPAVLSPSGAGLTSGAVLLSVRNGGSDVIWLKKFQPTMFFTGTVGTGVSVFHLQRASGIPSGGTVITPVKTVSVQLDGNADARFADAGLTASLSGQQTIYQMGHPSQALVQSPQPVQFEDENALAFAPGECLVIVAANNLTAGVRLAAMFTFY